MIKGNGAATVFGGVLLVLFWGGVALAIRSCSQ
jgi:hypothetical protein